ncbi:MAG TPA: copper transporter [Acidimicrobiales bacterium]|nr:copper transporter [Acidimicrobiales bacterium]
MINLRYHIISIVAVFLALGIGLALGSTFVDSFLVNELEDQVNEFGAEREEALIDKDAAVADKDDAVAARDAAIAEKEEAQLSALKQVETHQTELVAERSAANEQRAILIQEIELHKAATDSVLNRFETAMPRARLRGTSWIMLAPTGIDSSIAWKIRDLLTRSDGEYLGTLWIEPAMNFENQETLGGLSELYGKDQDDVDVADITVSGVASSLLVEEMLSRSDATPTPVLISDLRDLGLLRFDRYLSTRDLKSISNSANRVIIVNDPQHLDLHDGFFVPLLQAISQLGDPGTAALVEVAVEGKTRGQIVNRVRNDSVLAKNLSTFDEIMSFEGRLSLLLGLDRLPATGHYGDLDTSEGRLPQ